MDPIPGTQVFLNPIRHVLRPDGRGYISYNGPICEKNGKYYVPFPASTPENPPSSVDASP
jgi:hypothetical protein